MSTVTIIRDLKLGVAHVHQQANASVLDPVKPPSMSKPNVALDARRPPANSSANSAFSTAKPSLAITGGARPVPLGGTS